MPRPQEAGVPAGLETAEPDAARLARHELREHRLADGVLGADGEPEEQAQGEQLPVLADDTLQRPEHDEGDEIEDEDLAAPEAVRQVAEDRSAEEDPGQRGGTEEPRLDRRETELRDDQREHHADDAEGAHAVPLHTSRSPPRRFERARTAFCSA